jgi:uncharacterized protein involved in outer membrane biogenesis
MVILAVVVTVAVLFGAAVTLASIALFVAIAGLLLISFPFFFWAEYRKRRAELAHRQR